jgi:8-oxo-dGTP diphosphatase
MSDPRPRKLVVAGLIIEQSAARRVLISQRPPGGALGDKWEFPGGKMEAGESPTGALVRELREELGVTVEVGRVWDVLFHAYPDFDLVMIVYACRLLPGETPRTLEVADFVWVATSDLPGAWDILPADRPLIDRLVAEGPPVD